jgi:RNA polymerase sigma-B factor
MKSNNSGDTARTSRPATLERRERRREDDQALMREYARTRDLKLRNELVLRYRRLAKYAAGKFVGSGATTSEDLAQVAYMGLISAIERYDPDHGQCFATFALPTILGTIKRYLRDHNWLVKAPRRLRDLAGRLRGVRNRMEQQLGRVPTVSEMAAAAEVTEEQLLMAMEVDTLYYTNSLDYTGRTDADGQDELSHEVIGQADPEFGIIDDRESLIALLNVLDDRQQTILRARFWQDATQQQVADRLGISQMHVSRLERLALKRLREVLSTELV